eukprot:superscaffoldBa00003563_g17225
MVMHFSGRISDSFDREFRCMYADSQIIDCFYNPEEEGMPYYPSYQAMMAPGMGLGLDLLSDRQREKVCSENSSSQSSNSMSSVKAAPGMTSNTVYKVTQGHDKTELNGNSHLSPERRGGERGGQTPTPQSHVTPAPRVPVGKGSNHSPVPDRPPQSYGQPMGIDWSKPNPGDIIRSNIGGTSSKFQALGLYDHKPNKFHSAGLAPSNPSQNLNPKTPSPSPANDSKLAPKQRTSSNQFLNKLQERFLPSSSKDKETFNFRRPPSPHSPSPWGGPDLCPTEPESQQSPPPPLSPPVLMNRHDQKRMTLGHSKLDLVNHYNKMKSKQVYSRFELKSSN